MASDDRDHSENGKKGFSGLSSMVSDIDEKRLKPQPSKVTTPPGIESPAPRAVVASAPSQSSSTSTEKIFTPPKASSNSGKKWFIGLGILFGFIWLVSQSGNNSSSSNSSPGSSYQSPTSYSPPVAPEAPKAPSRPSEEIPPSGTGNTLSIAQIRYCLAEDIRLGAAKAVIDNSSSTEVKRFNSLVSDYNSRCGQYRYRRGSLENAKSDIEPFRSAIMDEGRIRFSRSSNSIDNGRRSVEASQDAPPTQNYRSSSDLSAEEQESIEAACSTDKYLNGPAAYNSCVKRQLSALRSAGTRPNLSNLSQEETESIEAACSTDKYLNGAAAYNKCLSRQLKSLQSVGSRPDLSMLNQNELSSIEAACSTDKYINGPAAYNRCLSRQLSMMRR